MTRVALVASALLCLLGTAFSAVDNSYYEKHWCGGGLTYLDDAKCQKKFPSSFRRDWECPVRYSSLAPGNYSKELPLDQVHVDTATLQAFLTGDANICITIIKRMQDGEMYYKYLCGEGDEALGFESWSSSKIFAMANAAGHLREECGRGLDSTTQGKHGTTPLGDLATIICSYDATQGYTSNSLSSYFHDIGWRGRLADLVAGSWLHRPGETLGGNYGQASPADLGFEFEDGDTCQAEKDPWPVVYPNTYSALSAAEMVRRIVMHREIPEQSRFPGAEWSDMETIMYGAADSALFPGLQWGGMTADTAIYIQSAVDIDKIEKESQGQWRIFSKMGCGYSNRGVGEIVTNGYGCFPVLDDAGNAVPDAGFEFVVSARASVPLDYSLEQADISVQKAVAEAVGALVQGKLG